MNTKQLNVLGIITFLMMLGLLCWNITMYQDIQQTQRVLLQTQERAVNNSTTVTEVSNMDGRRVMAVNAIDDRLQSVEEWIHDFNEIMFGEPTTE